MLTKVGSALTLWVPPYKCLNCMIKNYLKLQIIQFAVFLCAIFVLSGTSSATTVTGFFEDNSPSKLYVDIPLNLATASVVNLTYTDNCKHPNNVEMELYNASDSIKRCPYHVCRPEPWGPLPLAAGNWTVRLHCKSESYNPDNPVAYTLEQSIEAGVSQFSKDSEPDATSEEAITLASGRVFSGWIGYQGYSGLYTESNRHGTDSWDDYYFSLAAGTKIKIKLDYDQTLINALGDRDISIETYRRVGYNLYNYTHFDFSNWWQFSGDTTDEFTIPQDGIYLFRVVGGNGSAPKTNFGGYRMSVIVNGEQLPSAKIENISNITTTYWEDGERYETDKLIIGEESHIEVLIVKDSPKAINATLISFLSVRGEEPVHVGTASLLLPENIASPVSYETIVKTPANTPISLKGQLIMLLYVDTNTLLDKKDITVKMWGPEHKVVVLIGSMLLLKQQGVAPKN